MSGFTQQSGKSFIHLKKEAYKDAKAEFAAKGKELPKGYVPEVDLYQLPHFRDAEEIKEMEANPTHQYSRLKEKREKKVAEAEEAGKKRRRESEEAEKTAWLEDLAKRKADREKAAKERQEQLRRQRETAERVRANAKRKRATSGQETTSGTKGQTNSVVTGGARLSHGNARWRPMVVDSDDEEDLRPKPKRARLSHGNSRWRPIVVDTEDEMDLLPKPKQARVAKDDDKKEAVVVRVDTPATLKRKRTSEESDESDDEPLAQKRRRRFDIVRPESDKENLGQKKTVQGAAKSTKLEKPKAPVKGERPAAPGPKTKMSATAGISKPKPGAKKPQQKRVKVAKDDQPAEDPAKKKPVATKPEEKKLADKKPAQNKPQDKKPADKKPADKKPAEKKPEEKRGDKDKKVLPPSHSPIRSRQDPFRAGRQGKTTRLTQKLRKSPNTTTGSKYKSARTEEELLQSAIFSRRW